MPCGVIAEGPSMYRIQGRYVDPELIDRFLTHIAPPTFAARTANVAGLFVTTYLTQPGGSVSKPHCSPCSKRMANAPESRLSLRRYSGARGTDRGSTSGRCSRIRSRRRLPERCMPGCSGRCRTRPADGTGQERSARGSARRPVSRELEWKSAQSRHRLPSARRARRSGGTPLRPPRRGQPRPAHRLPRPLAVAQGVRRGLRRLPWIDRRGSWLL